MTMSLLGIARSVQVIGLAGSGLALIATLLFAGCGGGIYAAAAFVAIGLDGMALFVKPRNDGAIAMSILKVIVILFGVSALVSCAYVAGPPPFLPVGTGPSLLLASAAPSLLGAILLRVAR